MKRFNLLLLALNLLLSFQPSFADIACHRGNPERTGVHLVPEVTDFHGLKWKLNLGSMSNSALFYRNKFILSGTKGTTLVEPSSGKILWTVSEAKTNSENQTAAAQDGVIYTGGEKLHAIDFRTGKILWALHLGYSVWSPLAADGKIYASSDTGLFAFDRSGNTLWQVPFKSRGSAPTLSNNVLYVVDNTGNLYAIDPTNGQQIWVFTGSRNQTTSTAAVANGLIYYADGKNLRAVDLNGKEVWSYPVNASHRADPTVIDGQVYIGGNISSSSFISLNAVTGENVWNFKPSGYSSICSSSAVAGDLIYFTTCSNNYVVALERRTGKVRWLSEPTDSFPVGALALGAGLLLIFDSYYHSTNVFALY